MLPILCVRGVAYQVKNYASYTLCSRGCLSGEIEYEIRSPMRGGVGDLKCFGETEELIRSRYLPLLFNVGDEGAEPVTCVLSCTSCTSVVGEELVHPDDVALCGCLRL